MRSRDFPGPPHQAPQIDDHLPHGLITFGRLLFQRLFDDRPKRRRNLFRQGIGYGVHDGVQYVNVGRARERLAPSEQFIKHNTKRENIAARIRLFAGSLLGRHISHSADDHSGACDFVARDKRVAGIIIGGGRHALS